MYGLGSMAKQVLKNSFTGSVNSNNTNSKITNNNNVSLGHIEKRSASRDLNIVQNRELTYKPSRIRQSQKSSNIFRGAQFTGSTFINGTVSKSVIKNCSITGGSLDINNLNISVLKVTGLSTLNQLKITRLLSDLLPSVTKTYNIGSTT